MIVNKATTENCHMSMLATSTQARAHNINMGYTIINGTHSVVAGDDLLHKNGQAVRLTALDATTLEAI